jgi:hypothetical protein
MAAQIVELASRHRIVRARRASARKERLPDAPDPSFHFWRGASGMAYVHTVYRLIDCPDVPPATCVFVKVGPSGRRTVLDIGRLENEASSLNLAEVRQRGATLGASEVHLHFMAQSANARRLVELDLRAGLLRTLGPVSRPLAG